MSKNITEVYVYKEGDRHSCRKQTLLVEDHFLARHRIHCSRLSAAASILETQIHESIWMLKSYCFKGLYMPE